MLVASYYSSSGNYAVVCFGKAQERYGWVRSLVSFPFHSRFYTLPNLGAFSLSFVHSGSFMGAWEGLEPPQTLSAPPPGICLDDTKFHYFRAKIACFNRKLA